VEPLIPERRPTQAEDLSTPRSIFTNIHERSYHPSFDEVFERVWSNFSAVGHPKSEHPENLTLEILLTPEEARRGGRVRIALPVRQTCPACGGRGWIGPFDCLHCRGSGRLSGEYPVDISYPPGISESYLTQLSLDSIGIHNLYLTVYFRINE
jgi:DnaJ-class molecular chaperone